MASLSSPSHCDLQNENKIDHNGPEGDAADQSPICDLDENDPSAMYPRRMQLGLQHEENENSKSRAHGCRSDEMYCSPAHAMEMHAKPPCIKTCTSKVRKSMKWKKCKSMKCMCLVSSTPAGLGPNTNVGLHIPFGLGPCAGALELPLNSNVNRWSIGQAM